MSSSSDSQVDASRRVLIIGAGIGGLCLAQGLKKHGIPFTVFERDAAVDSRTQGYRIRISLKGTDGLEACLSDEVLNMFKKSTAKFDVGMAMIDPLTGEQAAPGGGGIGGIPREGDVNRVFAADRLAMRCALMTGLSDDELRYGMTFQKFNVLEDQGLVEAVFENGQCEVGGLLVAADGTYSRVRRQYLPDATKLLDADGRGIYGKTKLTPALEAGLPEALLKTTSFIMSREPHVTLFTEPMRFYQGNPRDIAPHLPDIENYMYWVLIGRTNSFRLLGNTSDKELFQLTPAQVTELAREVVKDWDPRLRWLFDEQHDTGCQFIRVSTMSPDIKSWEPTRVTVMGDSIHAMTPAGVGANSALIDAKTLLESLVAHGVTIDAVREYETKMRQFAVEDITFSANAGKKMFSQPAFEDMTEL